ncbi:MAG: alpha/beta fold hydrolase [Erythrobacter sp.]
MRRIGDIAVDVRGAGETLLFLHGIGGNARNWAAQLDHFAGRYQAAAWDARGYGMSGGAVGRFAQFADDAAAVIDALGAPAHVVGLSMGGRIALDLAHRYRDRVRSLTLANTSAGSPETAAPEKVAAFLAARLKPLLEEGLTPADIAETIVSAIAGPNIAPEAREALLESHRLLHKEGYIAAMRAVTGFTEFPDFAVIDVPTLVITASEDRVAPPAHARMMARTIPGARLVEIAGAGHISNLEAPEAFNTALGKFLDGSA